MKSHDPRGDPNVRDALKERTPEEVSLACCRECGRYSHYNDGPLFFCHWCGWSASGGTLDDMIETGEVISLAELDGSSPRAP
jgi:ribosomal protein L37AE/L43A